MKEILSIIFSIPLFFFIFSFPVNCFNYKIFGLKKINLFESVLINIILHSNILLLISFLNFNLNYTFIVYIFLALIFFACFYKKYLQYFINNSSYFFLFFLFCFSFFLEIAQNAHMNWDGVDHWFYKVQNFYQGASIDKLIDVPLSHYPHLGSYIWAFFWKNSLLNYEYFGRFFYAFFFLIVIFSTISSQKEFMDVEKYFLILIVVILSTDFYLLGGYQEYLLFFAFASVVYLFLYLKKNNNFFIQILFLLCSNIILWTKQEGFFYFIILFIVFNIHFDQERKRRILLTFLFLLLLLNFISTKILIFSEFKLTEKIDFFNFINEFNIILFIKKIILFCKYTIISFFKNLIWLPILLAFFLLVKKKIFLLQNFYFITFFILSFSFIFSIYIFTKFDLNWLLSVSLSRLLFALTGFYIFFILALLKIYKKK
jgi:hypothetical protein